MDFAKVSPNVSKRELWAGEGDGRRPGTSLLECVPPNQHHDGGCDVNYISRADIINIALSSDRGKDILSLTLGQVSRCLKIIIHKIQSVSDH
jgi:hypothetical protein